MKRILCIIFLWPFLSFNQEPEVKNVILLIGDGMGLSQMSSIYYYNNGVEPNFSRFNQIGLINTSSASDLITDSAAGATAFACGKRSYNGAISVDTNKKSIPTLIEVIEKKDIKSGLVATSSITHATPACFYAHAESRSDAEGIAKFLPKSGVDFFAGGGLQFFTKRADQLDYYTELIKKGFELDSIGLNPQLKMKIAKKYGFFLAQNGLDSKLNGRGDFLIEATKMAIAYLSQAEEGFFLMVEGSQIDWEGHDTNAKGIIEEVKDFDKAIGAALDFAEKDGHTLVIVTADHETGGFSLSPRVVDGDYDYNTIDPQFYKGADADNVPYAAHTTTLIPVFAYGPGAHHFTGIYDNTEIYHRILAVTKWAELNNTSPKDQKLQKVPSRTFENQ